MTASELKNYVLATLVAQRDIPQEISVFNAVIDFITQSVTTGIPSWTALLTFNADGTGDGAFTTHPDDNGNLRFWNSKGAGNIGHEPPTNPDINEDDFWIEVSPSSGSAIKEWTSGIYGEGLVIVYWNGELYLLTAPYRPYSSSQPPNVEKAYWKPIIADNFGELTWKKVAKVSTTAALPSYEVVTINGVENCLRSTAVGLFPSSIDGINVGANDSILVRHENDNQLCKVYELTTVGSNAVPPFWPGSKWVLTPRQDMRYAALGDQYFNGIIKVSQGQRFGGKIFSNQVDGSTGSTSFWAEYPHTLPSRFQSEPSPLVTVGDVVKHDFTKVSSASDTPMGIVVQTYLGGLYYQVQRGGEVFGMSITGSPAIGDTIYVSASGGLTTTETDWVFGIWRGSNTIQVDIYRNKKDHFRGEYASLVALEAALPTANPGDYAIVNGGVSVDAVKYIWDDEDVQWIIASGAPVANASESLAGIVEEGTDAEVAAGTATGSTGAKLFVSAQKLITWWTAIKAAAQTISNTWTFTGVKISGQAAASGKYNLIIIDDTGTIVKETDVEYNPSTGELTFTGINQLNTGYTITLKDSVGNIIFRAKNDREVEFGTDGISVWRVASSVTAGNASFDFRDIEGEQFAFKDQSSNKYLTFEKLSSSDAASLLLATGTRIMRDRRTYIFDKGVGHVIVRDQITPITTTTTAAAQNTIQTFTIPTGKVLTLKSIDLKAIATDGSVLKYALELTAKNIAGTVTVATNLAAGIEQELPNTLTSNFNTNISGTDVQLRIQNDSGTGKTYTVYHAYEYSLTDVPV